MSVNRQRVLAELREMRRRCEVLIEHIEIETSPAQAVPTGLIDQQHSDLGPKVHCAIVRERIARGEPGAFIQNRKHFLTPEAYAEECHLRFRSTRAKPLARRSLAPPQNDTAHPHPNGGKDSEEIAAMLARISRRIDR